MQDQQPSAPSRADTALPSAVATVESWTNGSYWRNYKLSWDGQADTGDKLCLLKDVQAYGDARAAAALAERDAVPVEQGELVDDAWYWVRFRCVDRLHTEPARYSASTRLWFGRAAPGLPASEVEVLGPIAPAPR